ncbi:MAG: hypothetical protein IT452_01210 [Planctomycetia bacterium]|nr:hypothetical protein [Planctomycetia bacterium]
MPQPPAGRPPANRPSTVRPAGAPAPAPAAPPSPRVAKPAAAPASQRVAPVQPPAAKPAGSPASQKVPALGAAAKPSPGTQRVSQVPAAQAPGADAGGPPSTKSKLARSGGIPAAPVPAPEKKPLGKGKLIFNVSIILSIPICIAIIAYGVWKKGAAGLAKGIKDKATDVGQKPENVGPQVTDEQKQLDAIEEIRKNASTKYAVANLDKTTDEEKYKLFQEILVLDDDYRAKIEKFANDPKYSGPGFEYITKGLEEVNMRRRVVTDFIRSMAPPEEVKAPDPNTRALGTLSGWNGTSQKLALIFLPKDASPADPAALAAEYPQTIGRTGAEIKDLPAERAWELIKGTVKEEIEKLDAAGKQAKCEELAKGVQVFEATKFPGDYGYLKQISGYYYKDQFARARIQIHDDRGVSAFAEYWGLINQAIGTPVKGWENVTAGLCEWRMTWKKDGVVYRLNAIGVKSGMDLSFTAYNEANWKALAEERGDKDVFEEDKQEDWADRTPAVPPQ